MKYAIISDIHSNLEALTAVLDKIDAIGVDQIVCLGDVVGYNADPNECTAIMREREIPTICGNHDAVACGIEEPWGFNPIALAAALWTRENLMEENTEWLRALGFEQDRLIRDHDLLFAVRRAEIDYLRPARFNDRLLVSLQIASRGKASLSFSQEVTRAADGQLLCRGIVKVASITASSFRPVAIPAAILEKIEHAE